jgi:non-reducing end alpha-L-arabinofuranosidase
LNPAQDWHERRRAASGFQSVNFLGRFIRNFNNVVYLAANGGSNPWDTATGWPVDTGWLVAAPWAPAS